MTPAELAATSEHSHQRALFAWSTMAAQYGFEWADDDRCYKLETRPELNSVGTPYTIPHLIYMFAIHNQGHGDAIRGGRAKAEGVKAGVPDIFLPICVDSSAGLFIELKKPGKKVIAGSNQSAWIAYLNGACYQAHECLGWEAARDRIKMYLNPLIKETAKWP